ncbi:uncharacterized protein LOC130635927 [Hydractinia symbiolongicarpus]|uniref:uncharacterized protein LOC130635927 n=1 Tax=Hydractinia symbiolongicarpus TaxID=13093 RepID=UPI00255153E3|nr:uncharacterized protein LOC130635927 [Hydractinia symbiolongicarpus]
MASSILDPLTCGFIKIGVYQILTQRHGLKKCDGETKKVFTGRVLKHQFNKLLEVHSDLRSINYDTFRRCFPKIIDNIRALAKTDHQSKNKLVECFGNEKWKRLSTDKKIIHQFGNCPGCQNNAIWKENLGLFPVRKLSLKKKADIAGLYKERNLKVR